ncbi:MAG: hypothetical protein ACRDOE_05965, partial [Streptosporangiaceae bacterium]
MLSSSYGLCRLFRCNSASRGRRTADDRTTALTTEADFTKCLVSHAPLSVKGSSAASFDSSRYRSPDSAPGHVVFRWFEAKSAVLSFPAGTNDREFAFVVHDAEVTERIRVWYEDQLWDNSDVHKKKINS